jgi:glyoxylase-like metal-dependent hydrolase (beta-lactamase superfamily II)
MAAGCAATAHDAVEARLGAAALGASLEAVVDRPGPVEVTTVVGADWKVGRSGLIDLGDPKAKAAGITDGDEDIQIVFHVLRHPARGTFLVDTGVEQALRDDPDRAALNGAVASVARVDEMRIRTDTASWVAAEKAPIRGVFLTHLHIDHISGLRDVPDGADVYVGPGEAEQTSFEHFFTAGVVDASLDDKPPLRVWRFQRDPDGSFAGVADVFGDGSVWALHVPGHTAGSVAFLARTPAGPVLMTGDACHTRWGWDNGVPPGTFSSDIPASRDSLERLRRFAARHPRLDVRLGHQALRPDRGWNAEPAAPGSKR